MNHVNYVYTRRIRAVTKVARFPLSGRDTVYLGAAQTAGRSRLLHKICGNIAGKICDYDSMTAPMRPNSRARAV